MPLHQQQKSALASASPTAIEAEYGPISLNWASGRWLNNGNIYESDATQELKSAYQQQRAINNDDLRQYIAASAIAHCMDGWSYLSRSFEARIRGESAIACHLAYYSELRASMSILASQGIGVFNDLHYIVDNNQQCILYPHKPRPNRRGRRQQGAGQGSMFGTHEFTWLALEQWSNTPVAKSLMGSIISPAGVDLQTWMSAFSNSTNTQSQVAGNLLKTWGMDLQRCYADRNARNFYSYRPTRISATPPVDTAASIHTLQDFWATHEPDAINRFNNMDKLCLKLILDELYFARRGHKSNTKPDKFAAEIEKLVSTVSPLGDQSSIADFLKQDISTTGNVLTRATGTSSINDDKHSLEMGSRASLLLRLATGSSQKLLSSSLSNSSQIQFWWEKIGLDKGFWEPGQEPQSLLDLWSDISDTLTDMDTWSKNPTISQYESVSEPTPYIQNLSSCERIALWGLAS